MLGGEQRSTRTFRAEVLDAWLFEDLRQVREIAGMRDYNERRPHEALGRIPPTVFRERCEAAELSTSGLST